MQMHRLLVKPLTEGDFAMKSLISLVPLMVAPLLSIGLTGCSVSGSVFDSSTPDRVMLKFGQFNAMKKGDDVVVTLRDGKVVSGSFVEVDTLTESEYASNYSACRVGAGAALPLLGDTVTLFMRGNANQPQPPIVGTLVGFDVNLVVLRRKNESPILRTYLFETVVDGHGHLIAQDNFRRLMEEGRVALRTVMLIESSNGNGRLPMERVLQVEEKPVSNVATTVLYCIYGAGVAYLFTLWHPAPWPSLP
jgi:hypothetical protein